MPGLDFACPLCRAPWPVDPGALAGLHHCPACLRPTQVRMFPALVRPTARGHAAEPLLEDGQASCFYHARKRAVVPCDACGRFLCALCDVALNGRHLCPACLKTGQKKGALTELETVRTLHDGVALSLAILPMLLVVPTIITGPMAVVLAVRGWNRPSSLVPRTRLRAWLAIILGTLQTAGWIIFAAMIYYKSGT